MTFQPIKYASVLLGAVALTGLLTAVSLAEQTMMSPTAKPSSMTTPSSNQSLMEQLKLTYQQKNSIRGIRSARTREINKQLTDAQKTKLQAELKSGKKLGEALKSLDLNSTQKKEIYAIAQKSNQDIMKVLTPTQQEQLTAYMKQHHQNRTQMPID